MGEEIQTEDALVGASTSSSSGSGGIIKENEINDINVECMGGRELKAYLIITNIGKRQNYGTLLRSAAAFGVSEVFVVGEKKLKTFGHQGTLGQLKLSFFDKLEVLKSHLNSRNIYICGIEICDNSRPIQDSNNIFNKSTAFMLGNEGTGMTPKQMSICDGFVYIPQYSDATASLNVAVAGSICLHHFATWAKFQEAPREGFKFSTRPPRNKLDKYNDPTEEELQDRERIREERQKKRRLADRLESEGKEGEEDGGGCSKDFQTSF